MKPKIIYLLEMIIDHDGNFITYPANDQYVSGALREFGEYSPSEIKLLQSIVKPEWTCIDIGSNIGIVALALAKICKRVIAFEPQIMLNRLIAANAAMQGLYNVEVIYAAVGNTNGKINVPAFNYSTLNNYGAIGKDNWGNGLEVDLVTLDGIAETLKINNYSNGVNLIKIDVEGMEKEVLEGASVLIQESKPVLWVENDKKNKSVELVRYVKSIGYIPYWVRNSVAEPDPIGSHPLGSQASFNMLCVTPGDNFISCINFDEVQEDDDVGSVLWSKMFRYDRASFSK